MCLGAILGFKNGGLARLATKGLGFCLWYLIGPKQWYIDLLQFSFILENASNCRALVLVHSGNNLGLTTMVNPLPNATGINYFVNLISQFPWYMKYLMASFPTITVHSLLYVRRAYGQLCSSCNLGRVPGHPPVANGQQMLCCFFLSWLLCHIAVVLQFIISFLYITGEYGTVLH